jgi:hypothetical protein
MIIIIMMRHPTFKITLITLIVGCNLLSVIGEASKGSSFYFRIVWSNKKNATSWIEKEKENFPAMNELGGFWVLE